MIKKEARNKARIRRHIRVREKISGSDLCPRLSIYRSNTHLYAQLIDDNKGVTIASVSTAQLKIATKNLDAAEKVGAAIAKKANEKNIKKVVFDRSGYLYHGRIKQIADAARSNGLEF